jgi:hypothetical protein
MSPVSCDESRARPPAHPGEYASARQRQKRRAHRARGLVLLVHRQRRDARGLHGGVGRALGAPGRIRCRALLLDLVVPARARDPVDRCAVL